MKGNKTENEFWNFNLSTEFSVRKQQLIDSSIKICFHFVFQIKWSARPETKWRHECTIVYDFWRTQHVGIINHVGCWRTQILDFFLLRLHWVICVIFMMAGGKKQLRINRPVSRRTPGYQMPKNPIINANQTLQNNQGPRYSQSTDGSKTSGRMNGMRTRYIQSTSIFIVDSGAPEKIVMFSKSVHSDHGQCVPIIE